VNATTEPDWPGLWALASRRFALGNFSLHGPDHWQRVERNALEIAPHSGADVTIIRLFAVLHDSHRQNEGHDPGHGARAAEWARTLSDDARHFTLNAPRLELICEAMTWHDKGCVSEDPTIGTCWDADRLDLPRVGIRPEPRLMSTRYARERVAADEARCKV
jgi:uncharacterized protein